MTPNQFEGDVVFHQDAAYCLQQRFDEVKCQAHLVVMQVPIMQLLDHATGDAAQENYPAKQIAKVKTLDRKSVV